MIKIYEADAVWSITNREGFKELNNLLSYVSVFWRDGPKGKKVRDSYVKHLIQPGSTPDEFLFLSGLMPRVLTYLDKKRIDYEYSSDVEMVEYDEPGVPGIVFRDYQQSIVELMVEEGRGVVKAATASGKSFMILGIISAFSKENILLLVHTKVLVNQLVDDLEKYNFGPIGVYSGKTKEIKRITVATIQSYKKIALEYFNYWQVVIIDECHHIRNIDSANYGFTLQRLSAPVRIGFTATIPEDIGGKFALEALVGPVITDYSIAKASDDGVLAKPTIYLLETPYQHEVSKLRDWRQAYKFGIALNVQRNYQIVDNTLKLLKEDHGILILISRLIHGEELVKAFAHYGQHVDFVQGITDQDERTRLKEALKSGEIQVLIASTVFVEGVDLPDLDVLINASGGKSEIQVLQKVGRGLRKTKKKSKVIIIDFMDISHRCLRNHYNKRMRIYKANGWETVEVALSSDSQI
jgi:superfamily II DNA or RNA helicase